MSKGRGHVQLAIVAALTRNRQRSVAQLAHDAYRVKIADVTHAHTTAVQKAIRALVRDGVIKKSEYPSRTGRQTWTLAAGFSARPRKPNKTGLELVADSSP